MQAEDILRGIKTGISAWNFYWMNRSVLRSEAWLQNIKETLLHISKMYGNEYVTAAAEGFALGAEMNPSLLTLWKAAVERHERSREPITPATIWNLAEEWAVAYRGHWEVLERMKIERFKINTSSYLYN